VRIIDYWGKPHADKAIACALVPVDGGRLRLEIVLPRSVSISRTTADNCAQKITIIRWRTA